MSKLLIDFLRVGTAQVRDAHLKRCIIAINSCCLFAFPVISFCALYYLIMGFYALILTCIPFASFFVVIYWLNVSNKVLISQHFFLTGINIMIVASTWLLGREGNTYIYHFVAIVAIFTIFQPEEKKSFIWEFFPPFIGLIIAFYVIPAEPSQLFLDLSGGNHDILYEIAKLHLLITAVILWGLGFVILGIVETYHKKIIKADEVNMENSRMAGLKIMSAGIAHEVNNPLAIISSRARQLQIFVERGDFNLDARGAKSLLKVSQNIDLHVKRIAKIVSGLRTFAVDEKSAELQEYAIDQVIEKCVTLTNEQVQKFNIELKIDLSENVMILCKPSQLMQVFLNLISNSIDAIKFQDERWIKIAARKIDNYLVVSVTDSGHGIPANLHTKIMQPFFTTKEVGEGTGLGLSVALGIIKNHNGELFVEKESQHTKLLVKLPIYQAPSYSKIA